MWSRRGLLQALLATAALSPLAACGFRPLYGRASTNTASGSSASVDQRMAGIRIDPIANRVGQQLHNALRDRFNPLGQPTQRTYTLEVRLTQRVYGALAKRDLSASRRNVELTANYKLIDGAGNTVLQDQSQSTTGYDEFDDPLNDISAQDDARRRDVAQLAEMIRTRVAVFLTAGTQAPPVATTPAAPAPAAPGQPAPGTSSSGTITTP